MNFQFAAKRTLAACQRQSRANGYPRLRPASWSGSEGADLRPTCHGCGSTASGASIARRRRSRRSSCGGVPMLRATCCGARLAVHDVVERVRPFRYRVGWTAGTSTILAGKKVARHAQRPMDHVLRGAHSQWSRWDIATSASLPGPNCIQRPKRGQDIVRERATEQRYRCWCHAVASDKFDSRCQDS